MRPHDRSMRLKQPDFVSVIVVALALTILAVLTFELRVLHP